MRRWLTAWPTYCFFSSGAGGVAGLVAQDLRQVVARLDGVQRIGLDGAGEQRLGAPRLVVLPGDVAEVGDGGAVLEALPDPDRVFLATALLQHRALVEARLEQARVLVGRALERVGDAGALTARQAARLLGRQVARHGLLELGLRWSALISRFFSLGMICSGAGAADRLARLSPAIPWSSSRHGLGLPARGDASASKAGQQSRDPEDIPGGRSHDVRIDLLILSSSS